MDFSTLDALNRDLGELERTRSLGRKLDGGGSDPLAGVVQRQRRRKSKGSSASRTETQQQQQQDGHYESYL